MKTNKIIKIFAISLFIISFAIAPLQTSATEMYFEDITEPTVKAEEIKQEIIATPPCELLKNTGEHLFVEPEIKEEIKQPNEQTSPDKTDEKDNNKKPEPQKNSKYPYVGRLVIPSVGIDVACYAGYEQEIVDAKNSAAYFYGYGHIIIGDHKNQGFSAIKSCSTGTKAKMITNNGTETYTCVGKIQGHNTGYELTDANYASIKNLYPGAIACYTCNDNWKNVTIVFFMPDSEMNKQTDPTQPETPPAPDIEKPSGYGCAEGKHIWSDWKFEWAGSTNGKEFHWESHECAVCHDEEWELVYDYIPEPTPEPTVPEENTEDNTKTETTTETIPQESEETVNTEINTTESVVENTES